MRSDLGANDGIFSKPLWGFSGRFREGIAARLHDQGVEVGERTSLEAALGKADVLHMTHIQHERLEDPAEYEQLKDSYILTWKMVERIRPDLTILHPLPRVNEIASDVDTLPGAAYFRQGRNGVFLRMALVALVTARTYAIAHAV